MIAVDSSALVAIALSEPDSARYEGALADTDAALVSPINFVETGIILASHRVIVGPSALRIWLADHDVQEADSDGLAEIALEAYLAFGKGWHRARLNLADSFSYALAKQLDIPLLYKGGDFALTDVRSAL